MQFPNFLENGMYKFEIVDLRNIKSAVPTAEAPIHPLGNAVVS